MFQFLLVDFDKFMTRFQLLSIDLEKFMTCFQFLSIDLKKIWHVSVFNKLISINL